MRISLDKLKLQGKTPDIIIVDYGDLLKGNSRKERHEELEEIVEGLRGIEVNMKYHYIRNHKLIVVVQKMILLLVLKLAGSFSKLMTKILWYHLVERLKIN